MSTDIPNVEISFDLSRRRTNLPGLPDRWNRPDERKISAVQFIGEPRVTARLYFLDDQSSGRSPIISAHYVEG
jgi:hypothetical protein